MTKEKVIPQIRFSGFTDTWEQREVSNVAMISTGGTPSTAINEYWNPKQVPWLSSGEVHKKYITYTDDKISNEGLNHSSARMIKQNSVLIALAGQGKTRGTVAINRISLSTNQSIAAMTFAPDICPEFVFSNLESRYDELRKVSSGDGTRGGLNKQLVSEIQIPYTSLNEQRKIGQFFTHLDRLITLHQRKYDKLTKVKKAMLEKMFPKNGSLYPEIRFKDFTDAWEQRKLGDTVQITMGQSPDGSTYSDVPSDYILVQGNADLQNGWVSPRVWTSQMTKKADAGDLIMSVRAPAGAMGKTAYNAVIGRGVAAIKGNEFIYQLLEKMDSDGYWKALSCGSTFESLNSDNIKNADVLIPDVAEQEKIGEYFLAIDRLITLHQRKLEKLKNIKKACLEKMFV